MCTLMVCDKFRSETKFNMNVSIYEVILQNLKECDVVILPCCIIQLGDNNNIGGT